ncbi:DNA transport late competence protein ComEC [Streptococcus iniae IUSA1]|nr:DNA transport late competence protein ComEC [Streptococcus iniae IUSA1]
MPQSFKLLFTRFFLFFLIKHYGLKQLAVVLIILICSSLYFSGLKYHQKRQFQHQPNHISRIELLPDTIKLNGDLVSFTGRYHHNHYTIFYKLKTKKEHDFFKRNTDFLTITSDIKLEKAEQVRNFNGFNYRYFLKNQGIYRLGKLKTIESISYCRPKNIYDQFKVLRRKVIVWSLEVFPEPMSHYMAGLLFGYLDKSFGEMTTIFNQLGIIHLFALSGMHVSFFIKNFRKLLILLGIPRDFFPFSEVLFSFFYAAMTAYSVSVLRSLLQKNLNNIGIKGLTNLAVTIVIMFLIHPFFLLTAGGVLSFTYAFLLGMIKIEGKNSLRNQLKKSVMLSLAVLPVLLSFFSQFNPLAIVLTFICGFLFDQLILPGLTGIFFLSPLLNLGLVNPVFLLLEHLLKLVNYSLGKAIVFGTPNHFQVMLISFLVALLYDYRTIWKPTKKVWIGFLILGVFLSLKYPLINEVTVIDVGQGDSIFVRDMTNHTLLIDVGGVHYNQGKKDWQKRHQSSNAAKTLIPYLKSRGVSSIDQLLLTHTDTDHVGDMEEVAKAFRIKEILVSAGSLTNQAFVNRLKKMAIKVKLVMAGDTLSIMGSHLQVLYPWEEGDGKNNDSLVLYGKLLNQTFLFTGDLEQAGEEAIMKHYKPLKVDVLKAGHHGSKGSSTESFIDALNPQISLISAGKNNSYKHPHKETIDRFNRRNITVYRTDQQGAIRFIGWKRWQIETSR